MRQSPGEYFGDSALAVHEAARPKGYRLAHATQVNLFFVQGSEFPKLGFPEPELSDVFPQNHITYLIISYNGTPFLSQVPPYFPAAAIEECEADSGNFPALAKNGQSLVKAHVRIKKR